MVTDANTGGSFNRYAYANNSPYKYIDPDGRAAETVFDAASLALSIAIYKSDPSLPNGLGVAIDGLAMAIPFVPGGVGVIRSVGRGAEASKAAMEAGEAGAKGAKSRNKAPEALQEAEGRPHSIVERSGPEGQYTTHNGDGTSKQYRGSGKDHGGIPRPNVKETGKNVAPDGKEFTDKGRVRPARPDEIPKG